MSQTPDAPQTSRILQSKDIEFLQRFVLRISACRRRSERQFHCKMRVLGWLLKYLTMVVQGLLRGESHGAQRVARELGERNSSAVLTAAASTALDESHRALAEGSTGIEVGAGGSFVELPPAIAE